MSVHDIENFSGATHMNQAVGERQEQPKFSFLLDAGFYHMAITRLENMQREFRAGKKNDV
jgi:hypothetical protein